MRTVHDLAVASSRARCVGNMGRTRSAGAGEWGGSGGRVRAAGVEGQVLQTVFVLGGKSMKIMEMHLFGLSARHPIQPHMGDDSHFLLITMFSKT
jgi:hypothetical protein